MNPGSTAAKAQTQVEDDRTSMSPEALRRAISDHLFYTQGKFPETATVFDVYMAVAYAVRDRIVERWINTVEKIARERDKAVGYLSAEFLLGPHLGGNLMSLGIYDQVREIVESAGYRLGDVLAAEEEPGLGNGGLGRLAACYMDSLATLDIPSVGYGIRYEFGIFDQAIQDGWQIELTDKWLRYGNPWEIIRPHASVDVMYGGHSEPWVDSDGATRYRWIPDRVVHAVPYDTIIPGYHTDCAATLRLWSAQAVESFDFESFNVGDYFGAVHQKMASENISKVLYPNDSSSQGKQLRLEQQFFFVSASLQDVFRIHKMRGCRLDELHRHCALQLNDTHPAIAIAELMRLLVDENKFDWDTAWRVTLGTFGYTNHTLLPEALERWPLPMFGQLLPRHLEIIYEINRRFLDEVKARFPGDPERVRRMSLIDESGPRYVRMAHLATVGSHAINGVAELHSNLVKSQLLADFYEMYPGRFSNKTNGVTPRRWLLFSNPKLAALITSRIGDGWIKNLAELRKLEAHLPDASFRAQWRQIKQEVKTSLASYIQERCGVVVSASSMFDVMVKRIHEYKRQHLNVLHVITMYQRILRDPSLDIVPRTVMFGGKAAPGYFMAKLIIKLINSVAAVINNDPVVAGRLKVVFLPDFNVTLGQRVYPAADLSEQISTAGKEASGTGNMKFAMNGALTIGTLDGANIEIRQEAGAENFFLFGLTTEEVASFKSQGYRPRSYYESNPYLREALDSLISGRFSNGDTNLFRPIFNSLVDWDEYMLLADYQSYIDMQDRVDAAYRDADNWSRMSILNTARMGKFSSDRAIREYCDEIWGVKPVDVDLHYTRNTSTRL